MKCAMFKGAGIPLSLETVPDPEPSSTEVVIKVGRCGICGSDLQMTDPGSPVQFPVGSCLGHEYAGEVVALGNQVKNIAIGNLVTAIPAAGCGSCPACLSGDPLSCAGCRYIMGGFGEYTLAEARYVAKLPANLSLIDGALIEPMACGSQAVSLADVGPESRLLVIGAGTIGLMVMYWARQAGCSNIVATARSRRNYGLAETMGASAYVLQGDDLASRVSDALGGPPDVVFECAGKPGLISQAIDCVRPRGTVVVAGICFEPERLVSADALMKQIRLQFSLAYTMRDFHRGLEAMEAGHVEPRAIISETIDLEALPDTLEGLRTNGPKGKIMVDPWAKH